MLIVCHSHQMRVVGAHENRWSSELIIFDLSLYFVMVIWTNKETVFFWVVKQHEYGKLHGFPVDFRCIPSHLRVPMGSLFSNNHQLQIPDAPRMEYLPTFGSFLGQMLVNILYMEHLGMVGLWMLLQRGVPSWFMLTLLSINFHQTSDSICGDKCI